MSYSIARAKIVEIVEDVTPTSKTGGLPGTFKHFPSANEANLPGDRGFFLRAAEDGDAGLFDPTPQLSTNRDITPIRLVVAYPSIEMMGADLDVVLEEDRRSISRELLEPANWGSSSTGINWIEASGTPLMPARRVIADGGRVLLTFIFTLVYR